MELFTNDGISHISSGVGVPLFIGKATELRTKVSFARICVEVAQDVSLHSSILVDIKEFRNIDVTVEYPWKPKFALFVKCLDVKMFIVRTLRKFGGLFKRIHLLIRAKRTKMLYRLVWILLRLMIQRIQLLISPERC